MDSLTPLHSLHFTSLHSRLTFVESTPTGYPKRRRLTFVESTPYGLPQASTTRGEGVDAWGRLDALKACVTRLFLHGFRKNLKILQFFTQKEHPAPQKLKFRYKKQKTDFSRRFLNFWGTTLQLVQNIKPIRVLFCTTGSCSDLGIYLIYNIYKFHKNLRTFLDSLHFTHFTSLHSLTHFTHSLHSLTHSLFTSQPAVRLGFAAGGRGRRREQMASPG